MIEDPLYLPKDTRVFIMCDANSDPQMINLSHIKKRLEIFGYSFTVQYVNDLPMVLRKMSPEDIQKDMGFYLDVPASDIGTTQLYKWYSYLSILRKARILKKHFMILFAYVSNFKEHLTCQGIRPVSDGNELRISVLIRLRSRCRPRKLVFSNYVNAHNWRTVACLHMHRQFPSRGIPIDAENGILGFHSIR